MRQIAALVLVQALAVSTSMVSSLHVHEYVGHDHPSHHHGPAVHDHPRAGDSDHHPPAGDEDHPAWQADACEPGRHAVGVSMSCGCIPQAHIDRAELPGPAIAVPSAAIHHAVPFTDVRAHGPPLDARTSPRAPPLTHRV